MNNQKGFTLVELLASMVILGILMMVAVPNVLGILTSSRNSTYAEDGKKLATNVEYKIRGDNTMQKPSGNACVVVGLSYLNASDFETAPNGGSYDRDYSFVVVKRVGDTYKYYVQLAEKTSYSQYRGVLFTDSENLYHKNYTQYINNFGNDKKKVDININTMYYNINSLSPGLCSSVSRVYAGA